MSRQLPQACITASKMTKLLMVVMVINVALEDAFAALGKCESASVSGCVTSPDQDKMPLDIYFHLEWDED